MLHSDNGILFSAKNELSNCEMGNCSRAETPARGCAPRASAWSRALPEGPPLRRPEEPLGREELSQDTIDIVRESSPQGKLV